MIVRIPGIGFVYRNTRKMAEFFDGSKNTPFERVVLVPYPHKDVLTIAFVLAAELSGTEEGVQWLRKAAEAGVDSIEHATHANDATLRMIRDQGLVLVPGLRYLHAIVENGPRFGITEDVIAQLSKVRSLKVISRTSVMRFKKREMTLREIGEQLGVSTVVEGSVRRAGGRVRIVAQLIDASSDEHLWADTYDRQLTDIFEIQSDVALHIVEALRAELSAKERSRIAKEPTRDVVAYQLYLMGRHRLILYTRESLRDSIEFFAQAIARDPGFALAHAATALAYTELGELGEVDYEQNRHGALQAAARALELDPELGESHSMMAFARLVFDSDWKGAEAGFRRALELNPGSADTYDLYGRLCAAQERHDEAVALLERGQELDPLAHRSDLATALVKAGRFEDAAGVASRAIRLEPQDARGHATLGWALIKQGRHHEGVAALENAVAVDSSSAMWLAQLAQALAMVGQTERAREILGRLEDPAAPAPASSYYLAYVYTGLGEHDRAMDHLERAVASSARPIYGIKGSFLLAPLREHPRFADLLKRLGMKGS